MKLVYQGKTKDVFEVEGGNYLLCFKDDVTGTDGVFDPGSNTVGLQIEGMGNAGLALTEHFFKKIEAAGIATHFIKADLAENTLLVKPAKTFGHGLECICRMKATGSFIRRFGGYISEGASLDYLVEFTIKDDDREDPPATHDIMEALGIANSDQFHDLKHNTQKIAKIVQAELAQKGMELYDIKFEFGIHNGQVILIDEISGGNMRVYKDGKILAPLDIKPLLLG